MSLHFKYVPVLVLAFALPASAQEHKEARPGNLIRSAKSGAWSAASTWHGGKVPGAGARVQVRAGHVVIYDAKSDAVIRFLHVAGTLSFATNQDTLLNVGLIKIQAGHDASENGFDCDVHTAVDDVKWPQPVFQVGTPTNPIDAKHTALIRLHYIEGTDKNSWPAIVCCGGRMDLHGTPMNRTWVRLGANAAKGDATVTLDQPVAGWKAGDRIIVTVTNRNYGKGGTTETRLIKQIDKTRIILDEPLAYAHLGEGDFRAEVANLSRNVTVESADPKGIRGHTMYHRGSAGSISYAEFRHLGKAGVLGRYSLHFHLCGDTMRGSSVIGASLWDSHNRWLTIHGTNYLVVRDCVGYKSLGHGFFMEDGTEVFNVLDRNLAVGAVRTKRLPKQVLPFDSNNGAGFWWANSLNTFTRNVAAENDNYGFRFEATQGSSLKLTMKVAQPDGTKRTVDIRTLPFVRFDDNEVHSSTGLYGLNLGEGVNKVGPDARHPFIVRNMKIWDTHYGFRPQVPSLRVENMVIHKVAYGVYHPNYDNHEYRNLTISQTHTEPFNRGHDDISIQYGRLTVDGLTFDGCRSGGMPLIQISDDNPTGKAETHMKNVKTINWKDNNKSKALINLGGGPRPTPSTEKGVPIYLHDWYGPGKHAQVSSMRSGEFKADPTRFKIDFPLTGNQSRVAEVKGLTFPKLLDPVDDLAPTTVITHLIPAGSASDRKLLIRGTTADNGTVTKVIVNGAEAKATRPNFAEWEIVLDQPRAQASRTPIAAHAVDAAGNVEKKAHVVRVP
ncbi:MAG: G8 domain-containing protein [Planctomycetes bacterium]|nr:G8 domain-containing protein [Planctomycetota bacterium]